MDSETQQKIEETVVEILKDADMESTTEYKIRTMAAEMLGLDLSVPDRKLFVRQVVESFLQSKTLEGENLRVQGSDKHGNRVLRIIGKYFQVLPRPRDFSRVLVDFDWIRVVIDPNT